MPELPELRVHAERLARSHSGSVLERFTPLSFTALKTFQPDPAAAVGTALTAVRTRGKYLIAEFGDLAFIVHLMQGGRLTPETGRA
ncbi:MAG TPA: DNA-formamidopyrimidine glycosylase family protein, partial [Microthrixaceae bacterium]|nr:DNA-formamidopyrimidine glycosylase family protein [Microthrixaceae bacterium]